MTHHLRTQWALQQGDHRWSDDPYCCKQLTTVLIATVIAGHVPGLRPSQPPARQDRSQMRLAHNPHHRKSSSLHPIALHCRARYDMQDSKGRHDQQA